MARVFFLTMTFAICCNLSLALLSSILWFHANVYGNRENFIFEARRLLGLCKALMKCTALFTIIGFFCAGILNYVIRIETIRPMDSFAFAFMIMESIVGVTFLIFLGANSYQSLSGLLLAVSPLGFYHQPRWIQFLACPRAVITRKGREELEEQAKAEAEILTKKALHPNNDEKYDDSDIGGLLKQAAINLGRGDYDVARFEDRLEEDWLADIEQLRHKTVEFLSKYMPFGLAEELHQLLECAELASSKSARPPSTQMEGEREVREME